MPTGDITTANIGAAVPLAYGPVRATGQKLIDYTLPSGAIVQAYGLAEGEWDGLNALFINGIPQAWIYPHADGTATPAGGLNDESANTSPGPAFHFHPGCDTPVGSAFNPSSTGAANMGLTGGGDQLLDSLWSLLPAIVNPLFFSRLAYYFVCFNPGTTGTTTLAPVGDWRSTRCRIFDANGNQTDYRYTLNPAWHFVDSWLRRVIKPEYAIVQGVGPDALSATEAACFDWQSIASAAAYYDQLLPNGRPRFQGAYAFASQTTLAAIHEQMLLCCRSYQQEYAGKISLMCDQPRPSTFLMTATHLQTGTITVDQKAVKASANRYLAQFLDLNVGSVCTISTISRSGGSESSFNAVDTTIVTTGPNPSAGGDLIEVEGVADPSLDGLYFVISVSGTTINCSRGTTAAAAAVNSTGGSIGYIQARMAPRAPEINHRQAQLASAQLPSSRPENAKRANKSKVQYDFANSSYDQQNRLLQYEIYRDLGLDQAPWNPPVTITLTARSESIDVLLRSLKAQLPGDVITLDDTVTWEWTGDYEIMEKYVNFFNWSQTSSGAQAGQDSGTLQLVLRTFNRNVFPDISNEPSASFATLPGDTLYAGPNQGTVSAPFVIRGGVFGGDPGTANAEVGIPITTVLINGSAITYGASSVPVGTATGVTYYAFVTDPDFNGGNLQLQITTNRADLVGYAGRIYLGSVSF